MKKKPMLASGWYKVDNVLTHKIGINRKSECVFFKIKWEGFNDTTWEKFTSFAKDAAPVCERYVRKNLIRPLE